MTFGDIVRGIRERRGLTQGALAQRMGQSVSYVSLIESNQRRATERVITNLRAAVELTQEEESQLIAIAGIPDPLSQVIQYALSALGARAGVDEFHLTLFHEDLGRILRAYLGLLQSYQLLNANKFQLARDQLADIVSGPDSLALPAAVLTAANVWLADVALKLGDPEGAKKAIGDARAILDGALSGSTPLLHAETEAIQGMIALREGNYRRVTDYLKRSLELYRKAPATEQAERASAAIGVTKSYNRLALLSLLKGDPKSANSYCDSALDVLKLISPDPNDLTNPRRLRLLALQAWAYAEDARFAEARQLRERTLEAYQKLKDAYGTAKTHLYMGDDARLEIQVHVEPDWMDVPAAVEERRAYYRERLNDPNMRTLMENAKRDYEQAILGLEQLGEALLLGRAYRGLGEIHRYVALREHDPSDLSAEQFVTSQTFLQRALSIETKANQGRRTPGTLESLAKVEWDLGHFAPAADLFAEALARLSASAPSEDAAALKQGRRCTLALQLVKSELNAQNTQQMRATTRRDYSNAWHSLSVRLARAVADAIERERVAAESTSSLSMEWTRRLYDLDQRPGARLVVQDALSTSHEKDPLAGRILGLSEDDLKLATELHIARYYACESRIREAHAQNRPESTYIDICQRRVVEDGIMQDEHARTRAREALRRLRDMENGYGLMVVDEPMPMHFFLKGDTALVELTYEAGELEPRLRRICSDPSSEMCFTLESKILIGELGAIFNEMRQAAERAGHTREWTIKWLQSALDTSEIVDSKAHALVPAL